ncbi:hypothetical protein [Chitinophaga nivalis]|uniref:Energy transducer TonB n=1 Tax=Chitinophaga nivalis TaxID=2991709 RepID=A0ABT3IHN7_9BACT|nr:hypothetical protein [Chitinophaga nivalis]MCW3466840.1 hypothetical protein [Chitinophaga nivalis]MCW3483469.1 hypothetical protein [Chitinophaga nivalis]
MEEKKVRKNIQALGVTIGVHALLLVAFLFAGFSAPPPLPDQDLGMEVNLGTSDEGMGDVQPLNPNPPGETATEPATAPEEANTAAEKDATPPADIATQEDEEAPEIKKPEKPVVKPKELPKKIEPKPVKPAKKPAETPPAPAPPAPKPKAVYGGGSSTNKNSGNSANGSNNSTGEGNTGKPGDRGQINGDPNAKGYTGGGLGGGRSDFHLNGRNLIGRPQVTYDGTETGYVAINIKVDQQGNVIAATFSMKGSTISNPQLIEIAKRAARSGQLKYNANPDAPEEQFGTVRFFFKAQ